MPSINMGADLVTALTAALSSVLVNRLSSVASPSLSKVCTTFCTSCGKTALNKTSLLKDPFFDRLFEPKLAPIIKASLMALAASASDKKLLKDCKVLHPLSPMVLMAKMAMTNFFI